MILKLKNIQTLPLQKLYFSNDIDVHNILIFNIIIFYKKIFSTSFII